MELKTGLFEHEIDTKESFQCLGYGLVMLANLCLTSTVDAQVVIRVYKGRVMVPKEINFQKSSK